jgi:hypothetical protein
MGMIPFALIGAGTIGRLHAGNIARRADAQLRWVVDNGGPRGKNRRRSRAHRIPQLGCHSTRILTYAMRQIAEFVSTTDHVDSIIFHVRRSAH